MEKNDEDCDQRLGNGNNKQRKYKQKIGMNKFPSNVHKNRWERALEVENLLACSESMCNIQELQTNPNNKTKIAEDKMREAEKIHYLQKQYEEEMDKMPTKVIRHM